MSHHIFIYSPIHPYRKDKSYHLCIFHPFKKYMLNHLFTYSSTSIWNIHVTSFIHLSSINKTIHPKSSIDSFFIQNKRVSSFIHLFIYTFTNSTVLKKLIISFVTCYCNCRLYFWIYLLVLWSFNQTLYILHELHIDVIKIRRLSRVAYNFYLNSFHILWHVWYDYITD